MTNGDVAQIKSLREFERRHSLFTHRMDGWAPWRILRGPIQLLAQGLPSDQACEPQGRRVVRAVEAVVKLAYACLTHGKVDLVVKTCRTALRADQGDKTRDVYFDGLLLRGLTFLKMEEVNSAAFDERARRAMHPATFDPIAFSFLGRILATVFPIRAGRKFAQHLAPRLQVELGLTVSPRWLSRQLASVYWQSRLYQVLFKRLQPKAVLVADTGEFGVMLAAARLGLPVIELQHGVFDAMHRHAVPSNVAGKRCELMLPDALACRGQFWIDQLASSRQAALCIAVGNEMIDRARALGGLSAKKSPKRIVFSSQGIEADKVSSWLREMIKHAPPDLDWRLIIKMHPSYDNRTTSYNTFASDDRVEIQLAAEGPNIFELLAESDAHLSISSACLFDAAALSVPSGLLPFHTHETLLYAVEGDAFTLMERPQDAWCLVRRGRLESGRAAYYSAPGFVENLEALVQRHASARKE